MSVATWWACSGVQWRADLPSLHDRGLAAIELGGNVSMLCTQAVGLLPVGGHVFRAAFASALAVGFASLLIFRIGRRLMLGDMVPSWLVSVLAACAAVMAALSPTWQSEATIAGGAAFAAALALMVLDRTMLLCGREAPTLTPAACSGWLTVAGWAGLTLAENVPVGLAVLVTAAVTAISAGKRPPLRMLPALGSIVLLVFALMSAGLLLRPLSPGSWSDVGRALSAATLESLDVTATRQVALMAWIDEVGLVTLVLGGLGLLVSIFREHRRAWTCLLIVPLVMDLAYPLAAAGGLSADPLAGLRALAVAAFAIAASMGVAEVVAYLRRLQVPMARTASVLLVVFHMTVVAVTCEDAAFAADRSNHLAAEEWTDEALGALPADAAVLVHSPPLTWRLWAAQTLAGARPDVIVIPAPLLRHGQVTANLLPGEPAVAQLLRDFALTGLASEYGLSVLADARPLMVELDRRWDGRVVSHLSVQGPWLRYAPQVLGKSDRKSTQSHVLAVDGRITGQIRSGSTPDTSTAAVVVRTLKEHATALSLVGLAPAAPKLLDGVERLPPDDPFVVGARLRLAYASRQRPTRSVIDMRDLLAFRTP